MNWDEYFFSIANVVAQRSKDPSTKVGAVLVSSDNSVLGVGYNGFPRGVSDYYLKPDKINGKYDRYNRNVKLLFTEHAERNCIYNAARNGIKLEGCKIYLSTKGYPCADCARAIIQCGIIEVITHKGEFQGKSDWKESCNISKEMLKEAGVKVIFIE